MKKRVLFYYFTLPHYRLSLFRRIKENYGWDISIAYPQSRLESEALTGIGADEEFARDFTLIPLTKRKLIGRFSPFFYLKGLFDSVDLRAFDFVVCQGSVYDLSSLAVIRRCRKFDVRCALWGKGFAAESKRNFAFDFIIFKFYQLADVIVPYGDLSVEYFCRIGLPRKKLVNAYNTVDVKTIASMRIELAQRGDTYLRDVLSNTEWPLVATVGRLIPKKRVGDLVRAVGLLKEDCMNINCVIGGFGPLEEELRDLIRKEELDDRIFLLGALPADFDNAVLAASDIAVFCGGHGLAINQAMALKTGVIVSSEVSPDSEMVRDRQTGWRYQGRDPRELASTIRQVLELEETDRTAVIQRAETEILEKRNEEKYAEAFLHASRVAEDNRAVN